MDNRSQILTAALAPLVPCDATCSTFAGWQVGRRTPRSKDKKERTPRRVFNGSTHFTFTWERRNDGTTLGEPTGMSSGPGETYLVLREV